MLRREKREVETQLASKLEKVLRCELTPWQLLLYKGIFDNKIVMHNKMVQLRKVCNHPYLFHPYTRSIAGASDFVFDEDAVRCCGKFALLDRILPKLKATGHRVLIFNQMTKVMNILEEYFRLREYKFLRLDGNTATADRTQGLVDFNAKGSDYFIFILSTKAGGLGLNLQSADTVILFDSDWNPQNDEQAMARAHRIGQTKQVIVLRLITTATVEEKILSTANNKLDAEAMVIQAGMFHNQYTLSL
jgi:SNF2 family DNA or RNA helicase